MEIIRSLKGIYHFVNILSVKKQPIYKNGDPYENWNNIDLAKEHENINFEITDDIGIAIRLGYQSNNDFLVGLDFDINSKTNKNEKLEKLLEELQIKFKKSLTNSGLFSSGTQGNYGIIIKIIDDNLINKLNNLNKSKIILDDVELLIKTLQIIPPSKSICKITNKLRSRKLLGENSIKIICESSNLMYESFIEIINKMIDTVENKYILSDTSIICDQEVTEDEIKELIELSCIIKDKYLDNYNDWKMIIWSLRSFTYGLNEKFSSYIYQLAHTLSESSNKYNKKDTDKLWENYDNNKGITIGTYFMYAKKSDENEYIRIRGSYIENKNNNNNEFGDDDVSLAELFVKMCGEDWIYDGNKFYYWTGLYWKDDGKKGIILSKELYTKLSKYFKLKIDDLSNKIKDANEDNIEVLKKKINKLVKTLKTIRSSKKIKSIKSILESEFYNDNIEWENNPFIFIFNNGVYDLKKCEFTEPNREDYMYLCTNYDYIEPKKEELDYLNEILDKIFPIEEEKISYLTVMSCALYGGYIEKFIMLDGNGSNGKSFLSELICKTLGNYAYTASNTVLLNPLKQGSNVEIANMNMMRLVLYREPDENPKQKINTGTMKELTGGSEMNARLNFSNNTKTFLRALHVLECNERVLLSGKIRYAEIRRLLNICFRSTFVSDLDKENGEYYYKGDTQLKTELFLKNNRSVMFKILTKYWKELINYSDKIEIDYFICKSIWKRTENYLSISNSLEQWFKEKYEKSDDDTDIIKVNDLYDEYMLSMSYTMSREERRSKTKKSFINEIENNIYFKKHFRLRDKRKVIQEKYGVSLIRNVLIGFKIIDNNDF
jgi:phage/plasmid-associated DNA primase